MHENSVELGRFINVEIRENDGDQVGDADIRLWDILHDVQLGFIGGRNANSCASLNVTEVWSEVRDEELSIRETSALVAFIRFIEHPQQTS